MELLVYLKDDAKKMKHILLIRKYDQQPFSHFQKRIEEGKPVLLFSGYDTEELEKLYCLLVNLQENGATICIQEKFEDGKRIEIDLEIIANLIERGYEISRQLQDYDDHVLAEEEQK